MVLYKNKFQSIKNPVPTFLKIIENKEQNISTSLCKDEYVGLINDKNNEILIKENLVVE